MDRNASITVLDTKLIAPNPPAQLLPRLRLEAMLDGAIADHSTKVVLVSAPAGSGKSTLLASWIDRAAQGCAWLQVEGADADPARFWTYLVASISKVLPELQSRVASMIPGSASNADALVECLAHEIAMHSAPLVVVIDDYHLISSTRIDSGLDRLVELAPLQFTLVLSSRVDPSIRLSRLRVRGHLTEVRADDLRFGHDEASQLLKLRDLSPNDCQIAALCSRTEGWAAGLVLAGMSLATSDDHDAFVADFHGDDRLVVDYLTDEFLAGIEDQDRERMFQTAILDRMCGALIDAVCGSTDGMQWLKRTASNNQLLIGLDRTGKWYRYHHLLSDVLRLDAGLAAVDLAELHRRAARWHQQQGNAHDAVQHFLEAGDDEAAADLIYAEATELMNRGQLRTISRQVALLGPLADHHAGVTVVHGWISLITGDYREAQRALERAKELQPNDDEAGLIVALAVMTHMAVGDVGSAVRQARDAPEPFESTQAMAIGAAHVWAGTFDDASPFLRQAERMAPNEGHAFVEAITPIFRAIVHIETGAFERATAAATSANELAQRYGLTNLAQTALAHGIIARTTKDPAVAIASALRGAELAQRAHETIMPAYALACSGDTLCHHGHSDGPRLLQQSRKIVDQCIDPGIAGRYLGRVEARHQLTASHPEDSDLVEDLTEREMAVLRYLQSTMSQREIANELYVSINTVKTHSRAIYRKLSVGGRKEAVQAARDEGLL